MCFKRGAPFNIEYGHDLLGWGHIYLMLANDLIRRVVPSAVTVGEDGFSREWLAGGVKVGVFNKFLFNCPQNFRKTEQVWKLVGLSITIITCRYFWSSNMLFKPPTVVSPPVSPKLFFLVSGCEWHAHLVFASGLGWLWSGSLGGVLGRTQGPRPEKWEFGMTQLHPPETCGFFCEAIPRLWLSLGHGDSWHVHQVPWRILSHWKKPKNANLMNMRVTLHETNRHRPWK